MPYLPLPDNGPRLYYEKLGRSEGPAIVLLPPEPFSSEVWRCRWELAEEFRIIAFDPRGRGRSTSNGQGNTIPQFASDLAYLLAHLEVQDAFAVGWSLGASVALAAMDVPTTIKGLVNIDQPPNRPGRMELFERMIPDLEQDHESAHRSRLLWYVGPEFEFSQDEIDELVADMMQTSAADHIAAVRGSVAIDDRPRLAAVTSPVWVFWGAHGAITEAEVEEMQQLCKAESVFFARSGHLLPITEQDRFVAEIRRAAGTMGLR